MARYKFTATLTAKADNIEQALRLAQQRFGVHDPFRLPFHVTQATTGVQIIEVVELPEPTEEEED